MGEVLIAVALSLQSCSCCSLLHANDYPGWDDERHCPTGLLDYIQADGGRPVYEAACRRNRGSTARGERAGMNPSACASNSGATIGFVTASLVTASSIFIESDEAATKGGPVDGR
jgi:hypothetical protein